MLIRESPVLPGRGSHKRLEDWTDDLVTSLLTSLVDFETSCEFSEALHKSVNEARVQASSNHSSSSRPSGADFNNVRGQLDDARVLLRPQYLLRN
jgi:hypothetical protein